MKRKSLLLLILAGAFWVICSFSDKNDKPTLSGAYLIKGIADIQEGFAVLNNHFRRDTVRITDGRFEFKGTIKTPVSALIGISSSGGIPAPLILEPGEITVVIKNGRCIVGGSPGNIRFQHLQDQLQPYRTRLDELRNQSYQFRGAEQQRIMAEMDTLNGVKVKKVESLVKADGSFAGFVEMLSVFRSENAGSVAHYLEEFKAFSDDPGYKNVAEYYKGLPKADIGQIAPDFTLPDESGKMVGLRSFRGKYVLVDFWFHNCPFCRKMDPSLVRIYADLKGKGLEIVSVSIDAPDEKAAWHDAIKDDGATWTELRDADETQPGQYGVSGYPTMFLLDKEGRVVQKTFGYLDEAALRKMFSAYIN